MADSTEGKAEETVFKAAFKGGYINVYLFQSRPDQAC